MPQNNKATTPTTRYSMFYTKLAFFIVVFALLILVSLFFFYRPEASEAPSEQTIIVTPILPNQQGQPQHFVVNTPQYATNDQKGFYEKLQGLGPVGDFLSGTMTPLFTLASFLLIYSSFLAQRSELRNSTLAIGQSNRALQQNADSIKQTQTALEHNLKSIEQQQEALELNRKALQQQEEVIKMTRQQLDNSIEEMQNTRKEMESQGFTLAVQRFENTFFNMLTFHSENVRSLKIGHNTGRGSINDAYIYFINTYFENAFKRVREERPELNNFEKYFFSCNIAFKGFKREYGDTFGTYFNGFFQIVRMIDSINFSNNLDETNRLKRMYLDILKTRLSSTELHLLLSITFTSNYIGLLEMLTEQEFFDKMQTVVRNNSPITGSGMMLALYNNFDKVKIELISEVIGEG